MTDLQRARAQAERELADERFRSAVDAYKAKLRARRWWHALFPWKVIILRRDT